MDIEVVQILAEELRTYEDHRLELLGGIAGQFGEVPDHVLIKGSEVVGTFVAESAAISEGYKRFGNVPFLVKRVVAFEQPTT